MSLSLYVVDLPTLKIPFMSWKGIVEALKLPERDLYEILVYIADVVPCSLTLEGVAYCRFMDTQRDIFEHYYDARGVFHCDYIDDPVIERGVESSEQQLVKMAIALRHTVPKAIVSLRLLAWDDLSDALYLEIEEPTDDDDHVTGGL